MLIFNRSEPVISKIRLCSGPAITSHWCHELFLLCIFPVLYSFLVSAVSSVVTIF